MESVFLIFLILSIELLVSEGFNHNLCDCVRPDHPLRRSFPGLNRSKRIAVFQYPQPSEYYEFAVGLLKKESAEGASKQIYRPFCTGVLLNPEFVLTAGYCAETCVTYKKDNKNTYAVTGLANEEELEQSKGKTRLTALIELNRIRKIGKVFKYSNYSYKGDIMVGNIALLKVESPFEIGESTSTYPACLFDSTFESDFLDTDKTGVKDILAFVAGYGTTKKQKQNESNGEIVILQDNENLISTVWSGIVECDSKVKSVANSEIFCLQSRDQQSLCVGDYGAPLLSVIDTYEKKDQIFPLFVHAIYHGMATKAERHWREDCSANKIETFTKISPFLPWINKIVKGDFCHFERKNKLNSKEKVNKKVVGRSMMPYNERVEVLDNRDTATTRSYIIFSLIVIGCMYVVILLVYTNVVYQKNKENTAKIAMKKKVPKSRDTLKSKKSSISKLSGSILSSGSVTSQISRV